MRLKTAIVNNEIIWYFLKKYNPKAYFLKFFFLFYATVDQFHLWQQHSSPQVSQETTVLS